MTQEVEGVSFICANINLLPSLSDSTVAKNCINSPLIPVVTEDLVWYFQPEGLES